MCPLNWNTTMVNDMSSMFNLAESFNQPIGTWNTANVTTMYGIFTRATYFNQPIGNWNTTNVTTMSYMFAGALHFNQPIGNWNTSRVTNMDSMFDNYYWYYDGDGDNIALNIRSAFDQDLSDWCVDLVGSTPSGFDVGTSVSWLNSEKPSWGGGVCPP